MSHKITKCIVHLKPKLVYLDNLLPLYLEMKAEGILKSAIFVAPNKNSLEIIKKNVVLYEALKGSGANLVCVGKYKSKFLNRLNLVIVLRHYLFQPVISFQCSWQHGRATDLLTRINRKIWGGKLFFSCLTNVPREAQRRMELFANATTAIDSQNAREADAASNAQKDNTAIKRNAIQKFNNIATDSDLLLFSFPMQVGDQLGLLTVTDEMNFMNIGNPRKLTVWQQHLSTTSAKYLPEELPDLYFFFPLTTLELPNLSLDNALDNEAIIKCLKVLKQYNYKIHTVFKPHAVTDMDRFQEILRETGYDDYSILNIHPVILAKNALFTIANYSSTVLIDANAVGCTTVDFVEYDSRGAHVTKGQSLLSEFVDHFVEGDANALSQVVDGLLEKYTGSGFPSKADNSGSLQSNTLPTAKFLAYVE